MKVSVFLLALVACACIIETRANIITKAQDKVMGVLGGDKNEKGEEKKEQKEQKFEGDLKEKMMHGLAGTTIKTLADHAQDESKNPIVDKGIDFAEKIITKKVHRAISSMNDDKEAEEKKKTEGEKKTEEKKVEEKKPENKENKENKGVLGNLVAKLTRRKRSPTQEKDHRLTMPFRNAFGWAKGLFGRGSEKQGSTAPAPAPAPAPATAQALPLARPAVEHNTNSSPAHDSQPKQEEKEGKRYESNEKEAEGREKGQVKEDREERRQDKEDEEENYENEEDEERDGSDIGRIQHGNRNHQAPDTYTSYRSYNGESEKKRYNRRSRDQNESENETGNEDEPEEWGSKKEGKVHENDD